MKIITLLFILSISSLFSYGQTNETDTLSKSEMSKLNFLVGNWEGSGWMMGRDGEKHSFQQIEKIEYKIDDVALLIEGQGNSNNKITHNALAIVTYNKVDKNYTFQSYLANGRSGSFIAELKEDHFYWYPMENMRYIIYLNKKGQWYETGEMNRNGEWYQFFEMTLNKK